MGEGERSTTGLIRYALGEHACRRRAWAVAAVGAASGLAPLVVAVEFVRHYGWSPPAAFWAVAVAMVALLGVRAVVQGAAARRRLRAIVFDIDDDAVTARAGTEVRSITRAEVGRIVEIEGAFGGLRVEARADLRSGQSQTLSIPRGGDGFGDVRARLERWRAVDRRGRRGPWVRIGIGTAIVAAMFFLPFALDDLARSKIVAGALVVCTWAAVRRVFRGR